MNTELLTNETIISLVGAGLGPETIVAKINASKAGYDTSTVALIHLKKAGVPDQVIAAMLNRSNSAAPSDNTNPDPLAAHSPGIYLVEPGSLGRMTQLDATVADQTKTSNFWGYALTGGLSSAKKKAVISNATSRRQTGSRRPIFYFYFNKTSSIASASEFNTVIGLSASSPSEFSLVRLDRKKDYRELTIGSIGLIERDKTGVADKDRIPFTYEGVAPGTFRVTPTADLAPGEYGFVSSVTQSGALGAIARVFDFSVNLQ